MQEGRVGYPSHPPENSMACAADAPQTSPPPLRPLTRAGRAGSLLPIYPASTTHGAALDSNLVAALIVALERAIPRLLLRAARSGAKLLIGTAGDLTRPRSEPLRRTPCWVSSSAYCVAGLRGLGSTTKSARAYSLGPDCPPPMARGLAHSHPRDAAAPASSGARGAFEVTPSGQRRYPSSELALIFLGKGSQHGLSVPPMRNNSVSNEPSPWAM